MPRSPLLVLSGRAALSALASPARVEVLEAVRAAGRPVAVAELARRLDWPANALTYHVRALVTAGVLVAAGRDRGRGRPRTLYRAAAARIALAASPLTPGEMPAAARATAALLRLAGREVAAALRSPNAGTRAPSVRRQRTWLAPPDLARLLALLDPIEKLARAAHQRHRGRPYALTLVVTPLADRGHARKTGDKKP